MMIKPIETRYKGYRFRSRLEARWAVFFDTCGYTWEYEPEGYDIGNGIWYLPDFRLSGRDSNGDFNVFIIEVKPSEDGQKDPKVEAFRKYLRDASWETSPLKGYGDFIVLDGPPAEKLYFGTHEFNGLGGRQWVMGPAYRARPSFWQDENEFRWSFSDFGPIEKALSARFEHGETP